MATRDESVSAPLLAHFTFGKAQFWVEVRGELAVGLITVLQDHPTCWLCHGGRGGGWPEIQHRRDCPLVTEMLRKGCKTNFRDPREVPCPQDEETSDGR